MFSVDRFIEACRTAVATTDADGNVEELVAEAVSDPASVVRALREPERAGFEVLHRGPDLTSRDSGATSFIRWSIPSAR